MPEYFFGDVYGDRRMEEQNASVWKTIAQRVSVASEHLPKLPWDILDIGCHTGGLLAAMLAKFNGARSLSGVEPLEHARLVCSRRITGVNLYSDISQVPFRSADIVVSHEVLYLVEDLAGWIQELKRILRPKGGAFVVLGSHSENTAWLRWRPRLKELYGHVSYVHKPMEILRLGDEAGFHVEVARLFPPTNASVRYSPPEDGWGEFLTAEEMLCFREQKLLFTFWPR